MMTRLLILAGVLLVSAPAAEAGALNKQQLFQRCYSQITQMVAGPTHPSVIAIRDQNADPIDECLRVFDKAMLAANGKLVVTTDAEAVAVLNTMHKIHVSWFENQDSQTSGNNASTLGTKDILDSEGPALHFTRALFRDLAFSSAVTGTRTLRPVRTTTPTRGAASNLPKSSSVFGNALPFTGVGPLIGVRPTAADELVLDYNSERDATKPAVMKSVDFGTHHGGGFLGEPIYLLQTFGESNGFRSNGAESMPRLFGRAMFADAFCRELPVIRTEDAIPFVVPDSPVPFRTSAGCSRCHASMDRATSVTRNFIYNVFGSAGGVTNRGFELLEPVAVNRQAEGSWPTAPDSQYHRRPPNGVLYFRNFRGALVNKPVTSIATLGSAIAQQDDFYVCAAKRYYNYFMGIEVVMQDYADPAGGVWLNKKDQYQWNRVVTLGGQLKESQRSRALIETILRSADYRQKDFGADRSVQNP